MKGQHLKLSCIQLTRGLLQYKKSLQGMHADTAVISFGITTARQVLLLMLRVLCTAYCVPYLALTLFKDCLHEALG
jgi:hypothetical protein